MHPTIAVPGLGIALQSHFLMFGLAIVISAGLGAYWTSRDGLPLGRILLATAAIGSATIIAGRLQFVLANWQLYGSDPSRALHFSSAGLHAPGAIIGGVIAAAIALPVLGLQFGRFADGFAPAVGIGIGIARFGCFLNGCCFGDLCALPWCVSLPSNSPAFASQVEARILPLDALRALPVHPLPLYFAAVGFGTAAVLCWLKRRKRYDGELGLILLAVFAVSSFLLEPLRADDPMRAYFGPWPQLLWITAVMSVVAVTALVIVEYRNPNAR